MKIATDIVALPAWRDRSGLVVFIRHGERETVPSHEFPRRDAPPADSERREAVAMVALIADRLGEVRCSPVPRCVDTAAAVLAGAKGTRTPVHHRLLGDPGAFVVHGDRAMSELVARGFHPAARQLGLGEQLPGIRQP
ncbi:MAG: histidine phosphatase family protein [Phycisphaeraceae bacterium]|nr:histidine phosphatase family protein [Phycisphaeraceae bacterium]